VSAYTLATIEAVEEEWARREASAAAERSMLLDEVSAAKAVAAAALRESEEARARLDRQAAMLSADGEELRRAMRKAQHAEKAAAAELSKLEHRVERTAAGGDCRRIRTRSPACMHMGGYS
jgi:chromosome segregation ATPase